MPLEDTTVTIYDINDEKVLEVLSLHDGTFSLDVNYKENIYKIITCKDGYHYSYNLLENITIPSGNGLEISLRRRD